MITSIAAIHVAKKQLGLDEDTYRAKLQIITGKSSVKDMTEEERQRVISAFRQNGFKPVERRQDGRQKLSGQFAKKLQALWIGGYNLGVVENRDDSAMLAFVKRQTGLDHTRFLHYANDARKAIESLKAWLRREAGVSFGNTNGCDWLAPDGAKIAWAQWKLLNPGATLLLRKGFDDAVHAIVGSDAANMLVNVTPAAWQKVMNNLGERVRAFKDAVAE